MVRVGREGAADEVSSFNDGCVTASLDIRVEYSAMSGMVILCLASGSRSSDRSDKKFGIA